MCGYVYVAVRVLYVLVSSPDFIWQVYIALQYSAHVILRMIHAGIGFGSGTETMYVHVCVINFLLSCVNEENPQTLKPIKEY